MATRSVPSVFGRTLLGVLAGVLIGGALVVFSAGDEARRADHRIVIGINGLALRETRDLLLPPHGWTLQVAFDPPLEPGRSEPQIEIELREERTGMTIPVADRLVTRPDHATFVVPEALGIREGLLAVRARATFADGTTSEDWRRLRIRAFFGGPPIGGRQIVHFDFGVDRDGDGAPDFPADLIALGLVSAAGDSAGANTAASPDTSPDALPDRLARRIAERALARVARAFDDPSDPNRTGRERDPVGVRFQLEPVIVEAERPYTTRICVGGRDPGHPGSVGHVRFDRRNARRSSSECGSGATTADDGGRAEASEGRGEATGIFPGELAIYASSPRYREVFAPFLAAEGGIPFGLAPGDAERLGHASPDERGSQLVRAIEVLGDALGTLMAHETGHALGLVAAGKPPIGLFGGGEGTRFVHAIPADPEAPAAPSLMDPGPEFTFEQLAAPDSASELRFRPIDYAYLQDRVVLQDDPRAATGLN